MRLLQLALLRYGHFTGTVLDFDPACGLHVVLGANESGKTTALAGLEDALFGIAARSPYDFLHAAAQLRLGLTVQRSDGVTQSFVRRKGNKATLRDADDRPLPDEALTPFLGGIDRERFRREFALDAERLREGARALGGNGGTAGAAVLGALGLGGVQAALQRLDEEARTLFGDRKTRRRLNAAADAWKEARRRMEETSLAASTWEDTEATVAEKGKAIEETRATQDRLLEEAGRLERVRRIRPILVELDRLRGRLAELPEAPALPADAEARFRDATDRRKQAAHTRNGAADRLAGLKAQRDALRCDPAALAEQDAIDALVQKLAQVESAERDLPGIEEIAAAARARLHDAASAIDPAAAPDALRRAVPPRPLRETAQRLLSKRAELQVARSAHEQALLKARAALDETESARAALPAPPALAPLQRAVERARTLHDADAALAQAERDRGAAAQALRAALAALPLFQGSAEQLAALPLPLPAEIDASGAALTEAERAEADAADRLRALQAEIAGAEAERAAIAEAGALPTREAIAAARAARDAAWALVRRQIVSGEPPSADDLAGLPCPDLADAFELLRDRADRLADARADEAGRLAQDAAVRERLARLAGERSAAAARHCAAEQALAQAEAAWQALWQPAGIAPSSPAAMQDWMRARDEVLRRAQKAAAAEHDRQKLASRRAQARAELIAALGETAPPGDETLTPLLARAEAALEAAERLATQHRTLSERTEAQRRAVADAARQLDAADRALCDGASAWETALAPLGLPAGADADTVQSRLAAWNAMADASAELDKAEARITAMREVIGQFGAEARRIAAALDEPSDARPAPLIVHALKRRLEAARGAARALQGFDDAIAEEAARHAEADRSLAAAEADLAGLRAAAGCADDAALETAIQRAEARRDVLTRIAEREAALVAQGDGKTEAELRAEAHGIDPDQAGARLASIGDEIRARREQLLALAGARNAAEAQLAAMRRGHDAAQAAQDAAHALADAAAAAARYARLHLARVLLRHAIAHFREQEWGSLLAAAGSHLAALTDGRYTALALDTDDNDAKALRAVRADGERRLLAQLSEGTRDALALALRLAAIAAHAVEHEPLPFIADDILVAFDDARAARAMALLAELGRVTQVILFTHHGHIATLAERAGAVQMLRPPDPPDAQKKGPAHVGPAPETASAQAEVSSG